MGDPSGGPVGAQILPISCGGSGHSYLEEYRMRIDLRSLLFLALVFLASAVPATSGSLADAPVVFRSGNWSVVRTTDPMTDAVSCTGIYKDDYAIQLSPSDLYIRVQGGIEGITLRFDDEAPRRLRLATEMEKKTDAVDISGADFTQLSSTRRLRVEVVTLVRGGQFSDIDLSGIREAQETIRLGCPASGAVQPGKQVNTSLGLCPGKVTERLKARGFTEESIREICKED
jgi:hypothetical protein